MLSTAVQPFWPAEGLGIVRGTAVLCIAWLALPMVMMDLHQPSEIIEVSECEHQRLQLSVVCQQQNCGVCWQQISRLPSDELVVVV